LAVSACHDWTVRLWDLDGDESKSHAFFKWHTGPVLSVAFGPDGKRIASAGHDGRIILWDVGGNKIHEWQLPGPVRNVAFAADGRHLAAGNSNGTVYVLRLGKP
jgi:WD40 repeat protein